MEVHSDRTARPTCARSFAHGEEAGGRAMDCAVRLTGDATLKGRFMRQDYFSFPRTHKLVLITNNKPRVREESEAVWRRLRLVPFDVVIPAAERDKGLLKKLKAEWPGILAWLVRGCLDWQQHGLGEPEAVIQATGAYREAEDHLGRFIEECCEVDRAVPPGDSQKFVPWSDLVKRYSAWCITSGETPLVARRLGESLDKRGFPSETRRKGHVTAKGRAGLLLRPAPDELPL